MKEKESAEKMSRRVFLSKSGKLVGLGLLSHFAMIGGSIGLNAAETDQEAPSRGMCPFLYTYCEGTHICTQASPHDCKSKFVCDPTGTFTCQRPSPNHCNQDGVNTCGAQHHAI